MPESTPAPPTDYPFGFVLFNTNQRLDSAELTNIGEMGLRAMTALLSRLLAEEPSTYPSGFFGDDCLVAVDSGLTMDVAAGMGFYNYNAYDADDFDHVVYRPIAYPGGQVTLDAHHATLPRIDVISIAPDYEDVAQESRQIWDAGTESFGPQNVYTRRVVSYTVTVTKGTPAGSPVAPATPSGHVKLAECAVPATSGAVTVTDSRNVLKLANSLVGSNSVSLDVSPLLGGWTVHGLVPGAVPGQIDLVAGSYTLAKASYTKGLMQVCEPGLASGTITFVCRSPAIHLCDLEVGADEVFTLTDVQIAHSVSGTDPDDACLTIVSSGAGTADDAIWQSDTFGTPSGSGDATSGLALDLDPQRAIYVEYYVQVFNGGGPPVANLPLSIRLVLTKKRVL